jgi:hypothetical protein
VDHGLGLGRQQQSLRTARSIVISTLASVLAGSGCLSASSFKP